MSILQQLCMLMLNVDKLLAFETALHRIKSKNDSKWVKIRFVIMFFNDDNIINFTISYTR